MQFPLYATACRRGPAWLKKAEILSYEEIERVARVAVSIGIEQIRLTAGTTGTTRCFLNSYIICARSKACAASVLTTNGILLKQRQQLWRRPVSQRINVSLDSLVREKFAQLTPATTRPRSQGLEDSKTIHYSSIKVNAVAFEDIAKKEALDFVRLARRKAYVVRLDRIQCLSMRSDLA